MKKPVTWLFLVSLITFSFASEAELLQLLQGTHSSTPEYEQIKADYYESQIPVKEVSPFPYNPADYDAPRQGGDTVADAVPIVTLPFSDVGTTCGYTNDYDAVCPYSGSTAPDVVYEFVTDGGTYDITLCNGSDYDTKLYIFDEFMNEVACNDDECPGYVSELMAQTLDAGLYYIIVDGYSSGCGNYVIDIAEAVEPGTTCEEALPYEFVGDPAQIGSIESGGEMWYYFTTDDSYMSVTVSLCGSDYDTKLEVWGACDDAGYLYYNDDSCGAQSEIVMDTPGAATYYAKVYGYGSSSGNYELLITGIQDLPQGDTCEDPLPLELPVVDLFGTSDGFTDNYDSSMLDCTSYYLNGIDIVYEFTLDEPGLISGSCASPYDYASLFIVQGCPDVGAICIASAQDGDFGEFFDVPIEAGTYFAIVSNWPSPYDFEYTINLSVEPAVLGCTDPLALNYDPEANMDDGSCEYVWGCTDPLAINYNPEATMDDGSCEYAEGTVFIGDGTMTNTHLPMECYYGYSYSQSIFLQSEIDVADMAVGTIYYDWNGNSTWTDDIVVYMGYTTQTELTDWIPYEDLTQVYAGTFTVPQEAGWVPIVLDAPFDYNNTENLVVAFEENTAGYHSSSDEFYGHEPGASMSIYFYNDYTDPDPMAPPEVTNSYGGAYNSVYRPNIQLELIEIIYGCTDPVAENYDPEATVDDGSCIYIWGCMDENAWNYDPEATMDDGSCEYVDAPWGLNAVGGFHQIELNWNEPGTEPNVIQYDDGILQNAFYYYDIYENGFAHGMRFDVDGTYDLFAASIKILSEGDMYWPWPNDTHGPVRVMVFDDIGGLPGNMIADASATAVDGWATIYPGLSGLTGSFYIIASHYENWSTGGDAEGYGIDGNVDYPDHMFTLDTGVWQTGDYLGYGGDYMMAAWLGDGATFSMVSHNDVEPAEVNANLANLTSVHDGSWISEGGVESHPNYVSMDREVLGFNIYREGMMIDEVGADVFTYLDTDPAMEEYTEYCYTLRAVHTEGLSPYSNEACAPYLGEAPAPPDVVTAVGFFDDVAIVSGITWSWEYNIVPPEVGGACGEGMIYDCSLVCVDEATAWSWQGDTYCDDGTYGIDLYCEYFEFDLGDCDVEQPFGGKDPYVVENATFDINDGTFQIGNMSRDFFFQLDFVYDELDYSFQTADLTIDITGFEPGANVCGTISVFNEWGQIGDPSEPACADSGVPEVCDYEAPINVTLDDAQYPMLLEWDYPGYTPPQCGDEIIPSIPFNSFGSNVGLPNNWDVNGTDGADYAYELTLAGTTVFDVTVCSEFTTFDTKIEIFTADAECNGITTGYYNDDDGACEWSSLQSTLTGVMLDAGIYYIVVDGFGGSEGEFEINVTMSALASEPVDPHEAMAYEADKAGVDVTSLDWNEPSDLTNIERECGVTQFNIYVEVEEGGCPPGMLQDCDGYCFWDSECIDTWGYPCTEGLGDGFCDDGSYGINFFCEEWAFDGGDCEAEMQQDNKAYVNIDEPLNTRDWWLLGSTTQLSYNYEGMTGCLAVTADDPYLMWNESEFSETVCGEVTVVTPAAPYDVLAEAYFDETDMIDGIEWSWSHESFGECEFFDCDGNCLDLYLDYLGDGICDEGQYNDINLNCEEWAYDEGDCLETCVDAPYTFGDPCYEQVIAEDPFCCDVEWDEWCEADYQDCVGGEFIPGAGQSDAREAYYSKGQPAVFDIADGRIQSLNMNRAIFFTLYFTYDEVDYEFTTSADMLQIVGFEPGVEVCGVITATEDMLGGLGIFYESDPSDPACATTIGPPECPYAAPVSLTALSDEANNLVELTWEYPGYEPPEMPDCGDALIPSLPFNDINSNVGMSNDWDVSGSDGADFAYALNLAGTTMIDVTVCSANTDFDTKLEIFTADADCNETTTGYYNDDDYNCEFGGAQSSIFGAALDAGTYYIVVDGYAGYEGNFEINVTQAALAVEPVDPFEAMAYESEKSGLPVSAADWNMPGEETITTRECGVTHFNIYMEVDEIPLCPEGELPDCDGVCFDESLLSWIGDGYCDDGTYGVNFLCEEYNWDDGDCEAEQNQGEKEVAETHMPTITRDWMLIGTTNQLNYTHTGTFEGCFYVTADDIYLGYNESEPSNTSCAGFCPGMMGDVTDDYQVNVLDIVQIVQYILSGEGFDECQIYYADLTGDGAVNVLDIVQIVSLILTPARSDNAGSASLIKDGDAISLIADGSVHGVQITLTHEENFQLQLTNDAMVADYRTEGTTTTLLVIVPEGETLFTTSDDFEFGDVIVATTDGQIPVSMDILPTKFALHNAYPNPFNPVTNLNLDLPEDSKVVVNIYNLRGQQIASLVNGLMPAGYHTVTWRASNVPSGMYLVRAEVGSEVSTQKVMLLK